MTISYAWARCREPVPGYLQEAILQWHDYLPHAIGVNKGWLAVYDFSPTRCVHYKIYQRHPVVYSSPGWHLVRLIPL